MTIEGNWIAGAMTHDYPKVPYKALELPVGPAGRGHSVRRRLGRRRTASKNKSEAMAAIT